MDTDTAETPTEPVRIPYDALSPDALRGVIESFVLREGTDYGDHEATFESKVDDVQRQLQRGEADIVWDPTTESVQLVAGRQRLRSWP
jgi:uncharacterized protein YheU (UPF0270 family)